MAVGHTQRCDVDIRNKSYAMSCWRPVSRDFMNTTKDWTALSHPAVVSFSVWIGGSILSSLTDVFFHSRTTSVSPHFHPCHSAYHQTKNVGPNFTAAQWLEPLKLGSDRHRFETFLVWRQHSSTYPSYHEMDECVVPLKLQKEQARKKADNHVTSRRCIRQKSKAVPDRKSLGPQLATYVIFKKVAYRQHHL